jgi:hypothetical protein
MIYIPQVAGLDLSDLLVRDWGGTSSDLSEVGRWVVLAVAKSPLPTQLNWFCGLPANAVMYSGHPEMRAAARFGGPATPVTSNSFRHTKHFIVWLKRQPPAGGEHIFAVLLLEFNGMAKTLIQTVVQQLDRERIRLETELHKVSAALTAFGRAYLDEAEPGRPRGKRHTISAAGRKRIAAAQRARWAKWKVKQKKS